MMEDRSFSFYESFYEALEDMTEKEIGAAVRALCHKVFKGKDTKLNGAAAEFYGMATSRLDDEGEIRHG